MARTCIKLKRYPAAKDLKVFRAQMFIGPKHVSGPKTSDVDSVLWARQSTGPIETFPGAIITGTPVSMDVIPER